MSGTFLRYLPCGMGPMSEQTIAELPSLFICEEVCLA